MKFLLSAFCFLLLLVAGCATVPTLRDEYQDWPLKPYPVAGR